MLTEMNITRSTGMTLFKTKQHRLWEKLTKSTKVVNDLNDFHVRVISKSTEARFFIQLDCAMFLNENNIFRLPFLGYCAKLF